MDERQSAQPTGLNKTSQSQADKMSAMSDDFRITHPKVIGDVLRQLMKRRDFLTVEGNNRPFRILTHVLDVNQPGGYFIFDGSTEPAHNRYLQESQENYFSASQDGVSIQFVSGQVEADEFEGSFAFRSPLPESLHRMQRREFFRAAAPLVESYRCMAILPDERKISWDIVDLSLDGLGLRSKDPTLSEMPLGTLLSDAILDFGKRGRIETDLRITNLRNIRSPSNPVYRIGCRFERFPRSKEQEFQRMITYLELARRGRAEGAVTKDSGFY